MSKRKSFCQRKDFSWLFPNDKLRKSPHSNCHYISSWEFRAIAEVRTGWLESIWLEALRCRLDEPYAEGPGISSWRQKTEKTRIPGWLGMLRGEWLRAESGSVVKTWVPVLLSSSWQGDLYYVTWGAEALYFSLIYVIKILLPTLELRRIKHVMHHTAWLCDHVLSWMLLFRGEVWNVKALSSVWRHWGWCNMCSWKRTLSVQAAGLAGHAPVKHVIPQQWHVYILQESVYGRSGWGSGPDQD